MMYRIIVLCLLFTSGLMAQHELSEFPDLAYLQPEEAEVDSLQRLNLVMPVGVDNPPIMVWIGGGAWSVVNRHQEMDLVRNVAKEGIAVASIGHRLSSAVWIDPKLDHGVQYPAHIEDLAAAIKWLYDHADDYGYDSDRLYVGGFSSGAHLSAMIALDPQYLAANDLTPDIIQGLIPVSGGYDIPHYRQVLADGPGSEHLPEQHVDAVFGGTQEQWEFASPTHYLENLKAPWLMFGDNDVHVYNTFFENYLRDNSEFREIEIIYIYHMSHADLWRDLSYNENSVYRDRMVRFVKGT